MNKYNIKIFLPLLLTLSVVVGIYLGSYLSSTTGNKSIIFSKSNSKSSTGKLNEILNFIEEAYVDSVDSKELLENSINSMLSNLDPHSYYISPKEFDNMNDPIEGSFEGIGVEFRIKDDTVMVVAAIANGPSEKLGIQAGDRIIKVDTVNIAGKNITNNDVIKLLKGPRGTKVNVFIKRRGTKKLLKFAIVRDEIPIYSVDAPYMIDDDIGYVKISRFAKTTYSEFLKAVAELKEKDMESLIIDLRNNGGGVLSSAISIADEMLGKNQMIVYTKGRARKKTEYYSTSKGILKGVKIAVLINENSASASEILAGAIQDNDRGIIIGRRSFGKGLVQEQIPWPDGSAIRLTVARYYTPSGRSIQKPYENGLDEYNLEAYKRYENGELLEADSIHFPDSLKYFTKKGKVVYGGGGIMPDVFIPLDTVGGTDYLYQLRYNGIIQEFSLNYIDSRRRRMLETYHDAVKFKKQFKVSNQLFNDLIKFATESGIERDLEQIRKSKFLIEQGLKADMSRHLYGNFGFYVIVNENDKTISRAIKEIKE
ncbi:MAG: S41 family peptidase [Flavobacteriales bacterium]|jgi:carboxyl-terminal processing protease|nr:S41 family peptidase [Flavobacteriales bacterium]MCW8914117.1 S41 family peptidase [Flavobacteriales bacterium]MCW8938694.1 S41 family peptidase [Flavobacteriales bacterium]MCW8967230.1 S41 family peptidase [Flavobacteriales bacterium]MCW8991208.1 S41 family peptidase [Flavobacteriales bacterium]